MTAVENKLLKKRKMEPIKVSKEEEGFNLLDVVRHRFQPYFGLTEEELGKSLDTRPQKEKSPKR